MDIDTFSPVLSQSLENLATLGAYKEGDFEGYRVLMFRRSDAPQPRVLVLITRRN